MSAMSPKVQFWFFLLAFLAFVFAAFRDGIGKTKTNFVALGLALWIAVIVWNTGAEAW